jgi:hypothetical protein
VKGTACAKLLLKEIVEFSSPIRKPIGLSRNNNMENLIKLEYLAGGACRISETTFKIPILS